MKYHDYLHSFLAHDNSLTAAMEQDAATRDDIQPFVERETARMISLLIRMTGAKRILELGTGIAYSTIWLGEAVRSTGGKVISVDNHERTNKEAHAKIVEAGLSEYVELLQGDAEKLVPDMAADTATRESFDLVFQDCGKYLYPLLYDAVYDLLRPGGLLVSDDTLFRVDSSVRKGLGKYVDEYNRRLFADDRFYSTLLPVGHGVAFSLKIDSSSLDKTGQTIS